MDRVAQSVSCFNQGFNCAQAIFSTCGPELGIDKITALKIATSFGGGMAHMGATCGAVTGAFMVIGLKYGRTKAEDGKPRDKAYALIKEFVAKFKSRNKTIVCNELLGYDINSPEGMKVIMDKKLFTTLCPKLVQDAAEILEELLADKK